MIVRPRPDNNSEPKTSVPGSAVADPRAPFNNVPIAIISLV
ncbi:hypothetical protein [Acinetobacter calcoaceticus]|nr:hypothetical protein [Acinetobacter calcoaceticus]